MQPHMLLFTVVSLVGCSMSDEQMKQSPMNEAEQLYRQGTELLETDPDKAIELLTKSLKLNPDSPPALYNRAVAFARAGRDMEAVGDIARLERVAPKLGHQLREEMKLSAGPYTDLAESEYKAKNYKAAIGKCDSALAHNPKWADAWVVKALALEKLGQVDEAVK